MTDHTVIGDTAQLIAACILAFNCYQAWMNGRRSRANSIKLETLKNDVQTVEKATNSMKDALVEATARASLAEGKAIGLAHAQKGRVVKKRAKK